MIRAVLIAVLLLTTSPCLAVMVVRRADGRIAVVQNGADGTLLPDPDPPVDPEPPEPEPETPPDLISSVDDLLSETPTGNFKSIFSTNPPAAGGTYPFVAVYNVTDFWGETLIPKLAGVCWYDGNAFGNLGRGVAINKRMVLTTDHGSHGGPLTWILPDGTLVTRSVIAQQTAIGGTNAYGFRLFMLDSELPDTVPITPLLSQEYTTSLTGVPVVRLDGNGTFALLVADVQSDNYMLYLAQPTDDLRLPYFENAIYGDSGSAVFAVHESTLVYVSHLTIGPNSPGAGPNAHDANYREAIDAAVATFNSTYGTEYTITDFNPDSQ